MTVTRSDHELLALAEAAADLGSSDREHHAAKLKRMSERVEPTLERFLARDPSAALRLVAALPGFWQDLGRIEDGRAWTERALGAWSGSPTASYAMALIAGAELAFRQGDQRAAIDASERAIEAAQACGAASAEAMAHVNLARVAFRDGDAAGIERHARRALELAGPDAGARRGGLHMLGWAAHTAGDVPLAIRRFEESLAYRRSLGDRFAVTVEMANLADLAAERGDIAGAATRLEEALVVAREIGSAYLVINLLPSIASLAAARGDWTAAAALMGAADALGKSSGLTPDPGAWQSSVAAAAMDHGAAFGVARREGASLDQDAAIERALDVARAIGRVNGPSA